MQDGWARLNEQTDEVRARLRDMQEARLDKALEIIMPLLEAKNLVSISEDKQGNEVRLDAAELKLKAVDRLVKVVNAQNVLRGLNAPIKIETSAKQKCEPLEELAARVALLDAQDKEKGTPNGQAAEG